jgi:hypothetical protein
MLPVMETGNRMSRRSRRDYLQRIHPRYQKASRPEKQRILDEFCANCSYHRKHAIRLLNRSLPEAKPGPRRRVRGRTYGSQTTKVLQAVWEAADYPWSVRLKALLPEWMPWIRRRFRLGAETERQLLRISPRSIDYRLRGEKRKLRRRLYGRTKPGTLLKHHIPLKTDHWDVKAPGFTEIDLVSHSGNSAAGDFCYSLNLTDIHTGWTETQAVLGKSQEAVRAALETIRQALPFALRGIDSDNGSEFINDHLYRYCQADGIQFTRGRPYKKDDNAHIEQKNWTHVRRLLGYVRYDSAEAREAINDLYRNELRRFQNLFLPSVKLACKERVGSRLRRRYEAPQTPLQRLAASGAADPLRVAELQRLREGLDPFQLSAMIEAKLEGIFALSREAPNLPLLTQTGPRTSAARVVNTPRPVPGQPQKGEPSSSGTSKKEKPSAVEMTRRGKRGKLQEPKRVSHASLRAWKSGKNKNAGFPHSHSAGGDG